MLFEPIKLGRIELKNRIIMPGFFLCYCPDGAVTEQLTSFYAERARGGAALIMVGGTGIHSEGIHSGWVSIHNDGLIEGHRELARRIKAEGARAGIQLIHTGRYSFAFTEGKEVVAPSPVRSRLTGYTPRGLETEEVEQVVSWFGDAAARAREAGYEAIEVVSSAGYLINQFLSPLTNQRKDKYGGSLENRMRFGLRVAEELRCRLGDDFTMGFRLGGNDFMPGGNTWREMAVFARELEKATVDYFNVTGGWHETHVPQLQSEVPRGAYAYLSAKIKEAVSIPVAASNRINTPNIAEKVLEEGMADLVSVARGFLADPYWPQKAKNGKNHLIRRCIGCMHCLDCAFTPRPVACAVNPECGKEYHSRIKWSRESRRYCIIGAGPAGLEAARVAATKGHSVIILEQQESMGGQWRLAAVPPGKSEYTGLIDYYANTLSGLGVEIKLNTIADVDKVKQLNPDVVILASGASPFNIDMPGMENNTILSAWEVLRSKKAPGTNIVIIGGGLVGCETALFLAEKGTIDGETLKFLVFHQAEDIDTLYKLLTRGTNKISIIEKEEHLARDIGKGNRWSLMKNLKTMGVNIYTSTSVKEISAEGVFISRKGEDIFIEADSIVTAVGSASENRLYNELKESFREVYVIGDAVNPQKLKDAVHGAYELINNL